jgi:putative protease
MMIAHSFPPQESVEQAQQRWNVLKPDVIIRPGKPGDNAPSSSLVLGVCTDSLPSVKKAVEAGCDVIYFEPAFTTKECKCRNFTGFTSFESQIITASGLCRDADIRFVLKFPRITTNNYLDSVFPLVSQTLSPDITDVMVENCGTAHALMHSHTVPALFGSIGLNIFNHEAVRHLSSRFVMVTLSPELSRDEIRLLIHGARLQGCSPSFALIVQGNSEAMVSEDCILQPWLQCNGKEYDTDTTAFFGIMDVTGHTFPVRIDGECRSHIYNSAEICLIDHLPSLMQIGINEVLIDARGRTGTYTGDMIRLYREAIQLAKKGVRTDDHQFSQLKDAVKRLAVGGITTGHFIRGLKES